MLEVLIRRALKRRFLSVPTTCFLLWNIKIIMWIPLLSGALKLMISLIINFLKLFQVYFNPNNYFDITGWSCELDFFILKSG